MSGVIFIPNQGVKFLVDEESVNIQNYACKGDNTEFCQIVNKDYPTQFQVKIDGGGGSELFTNPGFDTDLTGWTLAPDHGTMVWDDGIGEGSLLVTFFGLGCMTFSQNVNLTEGNVYKIGMNICLFSKFRNDLVSAAPTVTVVSTGESLPVFGDGTSEPGNFEYSFYANTTGAATISFQICVSAITIPNGIQIVFCDVSMSQGITPEFYVYDCNDLLVDTLTAEIDGQYAMVTVNWGDYPGGCYKLCVYPDGNVGLNLLGDSLCLGTATGEPILLGDFSDCIGIIP